MGRLAEAVLNAGSSSYGKKVELNTSMSSPPGYLPPSFKCPICGVDKLHEHTSVEIAEHQIKTVQRAKLHWHLENKNHATATGHSYYPSIVSGEGVELGYAGGDTATKIIEEHNRVVDLMLGFTTPVPPMTVHGKDHKPLRGESSAICSADDNPS